MVCKVRSGKNIKGALNYNEQKVKAGVAECIGAANFVGEPQQLRFSDKLARFEHLIEKNARTKTNCVHISLNFDVSEKLSQNKLNEIPTLKNLEEFFQRGSALKLHDKEHLVSIIDSFFRETNRHTRTNICDYMTSHGINAMFRENKEGRVYGLTFIDNKNGVVLNGSDLGKRYSGQMIIQRFQVKPESLKYQERENNQIQNNNIHYQQHESSHHFKKHVNNDIVRTISDLMKPIKSDSDSIDPGLKKKRKPKRRLHF